MDAQARSLGSKNFDFYGIGKRRRHGGHFLEIARQKSVAGDGILLNTMAPVQSFPVVETTTNDEPDFEVVLLDDDEVDAAATNEYVRQLGEKSLCAMNQRFHNKNVNDKKHDLCR